MRCPAPDAALMHAVSRAGVMRCCYSQSASCAEQQAPRNARKKTEPAVRDNHTQRDQHVLFIDHTKQIQTRLLMRRATLGPTSSYAGRAIRRGGSSLGLLGFVISRVSHTQARDPRRKSSYAESESSHTACHAQTEGPGLSYAGLPA